MALTRRSRPATLWLQILLVGGLACAVIVLVQVYRLQRSNFSVVERALRDYSTFAAWSYGQHLTSRVRESVDELLGGVNHGDGLHTSPRIPDARDMGHGIPMDLECNCHRPDHGPMPLHFIAFTLGSDTVSIGVNLAKPSVPGWIADSLEPRAIEVPALRIPPDEVRWLNNLLSNVARGPATDWGYHLIIERRQDRVRFMAARPMPTLWGDTVVYAFEYPPESLDSIFTSVLSASDLLPASVVAGRENRDVLDVEVADAVGGPLFSTIGNRRFDVAGTSNLPQSFAGLRIRAQLKPEMAEAILIGGVPESRVPILLVILLLALGLTALAAVQLRREVRFAAERAGFVANVSHELRTPLSQIRLVLDTLKLGRGDEPATRAQALQVADREALRLQHLVEGVLRFTRGTRPNESPRMETDAAQEARAVIDEFTPLAAPHRMTVTLDTAGPVPARLQRGALRQILLNLLDNAMKYGGDGTEVRVQVRPMASGGGARLRVDDNGPGVPPKERDRIWRPFERGGVARARAAGGSGIGLTIVREIAEEHGGRAWVESTPSGGASFIVDLPDEPAA